MSTLILSCAVLLITVASYPVNGEGIFSIPISSLYNARFPITYHLILFLYMVIAVSETIRAHAARDQISRLYSGISAIGLTLLLFITENVEPVHDIIAFITFGVITCYGLILAYSASSQTLAVLALVAAVCTPFLFSGDDLTIGISENIILASVLLIINTCRDHRLFSYAKTLDDKSGNWIRLTKGSLFANSWAVFCVLVVGNTGFLNPSLLGVPIFGLVAWLGGYLACQRDFSAMFRILSLIGSLVISIVITSAMGLLSHSLSAIVVTTFTLAFSLACVACYLIYDEIGDA